MSGDVSTHLFALSDIPYCPHPDLVLDETITESLIFSDLEVGITAMIDETSIIPSHSLEVSSRPYDDRRNRFTESITSSWLYARA